MEQNLQLPKEKTRKIIVYATLSFCFSIVAALIFMGSADNTLHTSALAWAFSTSIFVIAGYVFGTVIDNWNEVRYMPMAAQKESRPVSIQKEDGSR